jgi:hypothetical protein
MGDFEAPLRDASKSPMSKPVSRIAAGEVHCQQSNGDDAVRNPAMRKKTPPVGRGSLRTNDPSNQSHLAAAGISMR